MAKRKHRGRLCCSVRGTIQPHLPRMSRVLLTARMTMSTCMNAMPTYVYSPETATTGWQLHHDAFIFWHVDYSRLNWNNQAKVRNPQNSSLGTQESPPALLAISFVGVADSQHQRAVWD